jgi:hypothetical protein
VAGVDRRSVLARLVGSIEEVFHAYRESPKRACRRTSCLVAGSVSIEEGPGPNCRFVFRDPP